MEKKILRSWVVILFISALYFIVGRLSFSILFEPENIAAIWPASGVYLSSLLLIRKELRPYLVTALFFTGLLIELQAGSPLSISILFAFSGSFEAVLSAWLITRFITDRLVFNRIKQVLIFTGVSVVFTTSIASAIAAMGPWLLTGTSYFQAWAWWWSSDAIGNLLVTPLVLSWSQFSLTRLRQLRPAYIAEFLMLIILMSALNYAVIRGQHNTDRLLSYLNVLVFPFLIWAAIRFRVRGVTSAIIVLAFGLLYFSYTGDLEISSAGSSLKTVMVIQFYLAIASITSLLLAALVTDHEQAEMLLRQNTSEMEAQNEEYQQVNRELTETNEELSFAKNRAEISESQLWARNEELKKRNDFIQIILDNLPIGLSLNRVEDGQAIYANKKFEEIYGWELCEVDSVRSFFESVYPDIGYREVITKRIMEDVSSGDPSRMHWENIFVTHKDGTVRVVNAVNIPLYGHNMMVSTVMDITELHRIQKDLLHAKEKAEESDRLKTAFLQNMSHEIRTPMNAIMGFTSLIAENCNDRQMIEHYSEIITSRSADLLKIINDILDIARVESGQWPTNIEEFSLTTFFSDLETFFTERKNKTGKEMISFRLKCCCQEENVIITDRVKLEQIFINLIDNAFKFTHSGTVEGGCMPDSNRGIVFYVSDTGIGIPADKHTVIFDRFTQLRHEDGHIYGGTGLGLPIVRGLVSLLGGKIWLESEPGRGTTFYFTIDLRRAESSDRLLATDNKKDEFHFTNKTVLVVEDDKYNAEYISKVLSLAGLRIIHTYYGSDAVKIALSQSPDIVLMDIRLPDISGYDAMRQIRQQRPDLKVIAQTAYATQEDKQKAHEAGCVDYISKPLNRGLLLSIIDKHLTA